MRIEGIVDIQDNSDLFIAAVEAAAETALDAAGMQAATLAARELQKTPSRIDTGLLHNSITWAVGGKPAAISSYSADRPSKYNENDVYSILQAARTGSYSGIAPADTNKTRSVYIGTNVEYAIYVHEGTKRMAPNHFLKNAISKNRGELSEIMKRILQSG